MDIDTAHHTLNRFILQNSDMSPDALSNARIALAYLVEQAHKHEALLAASERVLPKTEAALDTLIAERDAALTVVAAAIELVGAYQMQWHNGMYLVGRQEFERLTRALEPYRIKDST